MLNLKDGRPIGQIHGGKYNKEIIYLNDDEDSLEGCQRIDLKKNKLSPLMNPDRREISFVAGPSGSGKSVYSVALAKNYRKIYPKAPIYVFSRADIENDPAFNKLKVQQIELDETLVTDPIDITEIEEGSLIIFDDCGTITDKAVKDAIIDLQMDLMEVGRKMSLYVIITQHLINGADKKLSRTILNELSSFTFFPKSGSAYQIRYALKQYFGMTKTQIDEILALKSRWATVLKSYPQCVLYEHGVYLL